MMPVVVADMDAERHQRETRSINQLVGQKLEYVQLGRAIVLTFIGGSRVLIETIAQLDGPNGRADVEPGDHRSDILATLLGVVVRAAWTCDTGDLHITFDGGSELVVGVDPDVESWAVASRDGVLVVCLARGELAVWGGAPPSRPFA
jgi:hypothetical protein